MNLIPSDFLDDKKPVSPADVITPTVVPDSKQTKSEPIKTTPDGFSSGKQCAMNLDKIGKVLKVWLFGQLRSTNDYRHVISTLYSLPNDFTVHIFIHSPGGSITVGCNILTAMERCKATIITHNIGTAASCGSLILAFGDKIHVDPNTTTMFHNAGFGNQDSVHRLLTQTTHTINAVMHFFERMQARGIITEDEIEGIVKRGEEYYHTSVVMEERLRANNLWYEGE